MKRKGKKILSVMLASLFLLSFSISTLADVTISNPVSTTDSTMASGKKVVWDCIYFGNYPQTEVKSTDSVYNSLKSATGWNSSGDITLNGVKYRRITSSNATHVQSGGDYYNWTSGYHYFKYEPIKWRVLNVSSSRAFLVSDQLLDDQMYNKVQTNGIVWSNSFMRNWLNGTFYSNAFTSTEQSAINSTTLTNTDTYTDPMAGSYTFGGSTTSDKVFLLSNTEASMYGFCGTASVKDEGRVAKSTDYAKAMGVQIYADDAGYWWLRSVGSSCAMDYNTMQVSPKSAVAVEPYGSLVKTGFDYDSYAAGVRPAIYLNLSNTSLYRSAGKISSDGKQPTDVTPTTPTTPTTKPTTPVVKKTQVITAYDKVVNYQYNAVFNLGENTNGDGKFTYSSSNSSIIAIDSYGRCTIKGYGKAWITIVASETATFTKASRNVSVTVIPKQMKIKSAKSPKKGRLTVVWAKDSTVSGYQVYISTNKSFKSGVSQKKFPMKTVKINALKGFKSKKVYYVKIRSYRKVAGVSYYGPWSYIKKIKIR